GADETPWPIIFRHWPSARQCLGPKPRERLYHRTRRHPSTSRWSTKPWQSRLVGLRNQRDVNLLALFFVLGRSWIHGGLIWLGQFLFLLRLRSRFDLAGASARDMRSRGMRSLLCRHDNFWFTIAAVCETEQR